MAINIGGNLLSSTGFNTSSEITNTSNVVTDGLVLWYDVGNLACYNNTSTYYDCGYGCQYYASDPGCTNCNTQLKDMSGYGNDGTLGSVTVGYDVTGGYANLSGFFLNVNVDSFIRNNVAYTFSSFFYYNSGTDGSAPYSLMTYPNAGNTNDGFWQHINLGGTWLWRTEDNVSGEFGGTVASSPFSSGNWYSLTTVVKTNTIIYYLNGEYYTTISTTFQWANLRTDGTAYLYIGSGYGESYIMTGKSTIMLMYNKELSSSEVLQNFNSGRQRFGI